MNEKPADTTVNAGNVKRLGYPSLTLSLIKHMLTSVLKQTTSLERGEKGG